MLNKTEKGFTLIELLVVISIIGLLASIVLVSLNSARNKAKYARSKEEIAQFIQLALNAQGEKVQTLMQITGNPCSECSCRGRNIQSIADSDPCVVNWYNALTKIQEAAGFGTNIKMKRDPWDAPYGLDENEQESGSSDCRHDYIFTAGPDGIPGTADDYGININHIFCSP